MISFIASGTDALVVRIRNIIYCKIYEYYVISTLKHGNLYIM